MALELAEKNRVTIEQVWDTLKRIGFTPGDSKVTVRGNVKGDSLEISIIDKTIAIDGQAPKGEATLKGTIAPPPDPQTYCLPYPAPPIARFSWRTRSLRAASTLVVSRLL